MPRLVLIGEGKFTGCALKAWDSIGRSSVDLPRNDQKPERCSADEADAFGEISGKAEGLTARDVHAVTGVACLNSAIPGVLVMCRARHQLRQRRLQALHREGVEFP